MGLVQDQFPQIIFFNMAVVYIFLLYILYSAHALHHLKNISLKRNKFGIICPDIRL